MADFKLVASEKTYHVTTDELKLLIAQNLKVDPSLVTLNFRTEEKGDDRFGPTWRETVGIDVKVKGGE